MYYLVYSIIFVLSLLPLRVLYLISDALALILYYILRYRRSVVRNNLINAFPEKSIDEIIRIEKNFYRFFTQWIVETLKLVSISPSELKKKCIYTDQFKSIFAKYYQENKSIMALMGHIGNWEWAGSSFPLYFNQKLIVLYHPLSNKIFDRLMIRIRSRFGTELLPMQRATRYILSHIKEKQVYAFIADQCPSLHNAFWMEFLNQDTAVYFGPEKIMHKTHLVPVIVIVYPHPNQRGHYIIDAEEIKNTETELDTYPIMHQFMKKLESAIQKYPEYWLWSHKRWKLKRPS